MKEPAALLFCLLLLGAPAAGGEVTLVVTDPDGAAGRVGAPVGVDLDLKELLGGGVAPDRLRLVEVTDPADAHRTTVPVQFEPVSPQANCGRLWWMMPPGRGAERRFRLTVAAQGAPAALRAEYDGRHQRVDVAEGDRPVLRYNHGTVRPPPEKSIPPSPGHEREWLDCLRTRQQPSCSVFYHHKIDVAIGLAGLSMKLGRSIRFDPAAEKVVGDEEAARLARPEYRDPWKLPEEYLLKSTTWSKP